MEQFAILLSEADLDLLFFALDTTAGVYDYSKQLYEQVAALRRKLVAQEKQCRDSLHQKPSQNTDLPNV